MSIQLYIAEHAQLKFIGKLSFRLFIDNAVSKRILDYAEMQSTSITIKCIRLPHREVTIDVSGTYPQNYTISRMIIEQNIFDLCLTIFSEK